MKTLHFPLRLIFRIKILLAHSIAALFLSTTLWSCSQEPEITPAPDPLQAAVSEADYRSMRTSFSSLEGEWLLTTYENAPLPSKHQNKATLTLTKQSADLMQMVGQSFVNEFGGRFSLDETSGLIVLKDEGIIQMLMAASEELMQAESRYINGLTKATYFELTNNDQLRLYLGDKGNPATEVMILTKK